MKNIQYNYTTQEGNKLYVIGIQAKITDRFHVFITRGRITKDYN